MKLDARPRKTFNYIELFAGCGGLSLGLKSVGFDLVIANELSPMAAETYAYNFFREDLEQIAKKGMPLPNRTLWLSSNFHQSELKQRLREDPRTFPKSANANSNFVANGFNLKGRLIVGSILELNRFLEKNTQVTKLLSNSFGAGEVDVVSGGPPCQSFSMAGLREQDSDKNTLPWEFAKFVRMVRPKVALLENVTGILRPFTNKDGQNFYAWFELAKAIVNIGYVPLCLHVNAKLAGVPQNRPRFILIGLREDFFDSVVSQFNESERELFCQPHDFFLKVSRSLDVGLGDLCYRDVNKTADFKLFEHSFLTPLVARKSKFVTVKHAIDDLRDGVEPGCEYSDYLSKTFRGTLANRALQNHDHRDNSPLVRRRFRIYQVLSLVRNDVRIRAEAVLQQRENDISNDDWHELAKFKFLLESGKLRKLSNKREFLELLGRHQTKKRTQRALLADHPARAALSIPDDACHYHEKQLRTLTVREMARIQSFPDNFVFRSKITTGGKMRSFEVPQYTQVGNAVPPLLGRALGLAVISLIGMSSKSTKGKSSRS
jgi:DNA (cytosine-5)-methyltransferase 1